MNQPADLPSAELLQLQARWLAPARSRLFRQIAIAQKHRVLDLGAGYGSVTGELERRSSGFVVAFDRSYLSLREIQSTSKCFRVVGDSTYLPLNDAACDLVFCQCLLLWANPLDKVIDQIHRVLDSDGVLVAVEPDYGGMIEYPQVSATRELWLSALKRAGAEPLIGRKLPGILEKIGFKVRVRLLDELFHPAPERLAFLSELPLTPEEQSRLNSMRTQVDTNPSWQHIAHLPFFLITATKMG